VVVKKRVIAEDEEVVVYRNGKRVIVVDKVGEGEGEERKSPPVKASRRSRRGDSEGCFKV